jgi:hypothetical protein
MKEIAIEVKLRRDAKLLDHTTTNSAMEIVSETMVQAANEIEGLKARAAVIKVGDGIDIPEFSRGSIMTPGEIIINTLEEAYHLGWHTGILVCGEILSKQPGEE